MASRLLIVVPPVAYARAGTVVLDRDFAANLTAYLAAFDEVVVLCPAFTNRSDPDPHGLPIGEVTCGARARVELLPEPYREDRYLRSYLAVRRLLRREIDAADYLLFSPHAPLEWSTLAASIARRAGRSYDMEADWDLQDVSHTLWKARRPGVNKLRKYVLMKRHDRAYRAAMRGSAVALLQGQSVFEAYRDIAPNPHAVLNVQVSRDDLIGEDATEAKVRRVLAGKPLDIVYAGRVAAMKGPHAWLNVLDRLDDAGTMFSATWYGGGEQLDEMRRRVSGSSLRDHVRFVGAVDRAVSMEATRRADLFLFCHRTSESPRNLVEALTCAAPLVGFDGAYARGLTNAENAGAYAGLDDAAAVAGIVVALDRNRGELAELIRAARRAGRVFDRDEAIAERIGLIKRFVVPPPRP